MIASIRGTVQGMLRGSIVVDVNGVGYRIAVIADALTKVVDGSEVFLWTHLAVRENAHDLYGFGSKEELQFFELLLTVSGVGPKSALAIMNAADIETLQSAIQRNDAKSLSGAYGIGKKTAEKIVLELRDKLGAIEERRGGRTEGDGMVVDALVGLGYSQKEAREAVRGLPPEARTAEERIREAIRIASRAL